jgi:endo-beta-N-acetylglucosaminidase D
MSSVQLYRYDISGGMARNLSQAFLGRHVEAIWHTGIVVFGKEYYFDGGVGVVSERAGSTRFGRPLRVDTLGTTSKQATEFEAWVGRMRSTMFGPNDYNLLQRNCNHFTQEASMFLLGVGIGDDIRNMIHDLLSTPMGSMIRPMLEQMTHSGGPQFAAQGARPPPPPTTPLVAPAALLSAKSSLSPVDIETLQLALAMLESSIDNDQQRRAFVVSMQTLVSVAQQIISDPHTLKYRRIKASSSTFTDKILAGQHAIYAEPINDILSVAGFASVTESGEMYYVLSDSKGSKRVLEELRTLLQQAVSSSLQESTHYTATDVQTPDCVATSATALPAEASRTDGALAWRRLSSIHPQYAPVPVGAEGGDRLYSIRYQNAHYGKAALRHLPNGAFSLGGAHVLVCAPSGALEASREVSLPQEASIDVEVLCSAAAAPSHEVPSWLPVWLVSGEASKRALLATSDGTLALRSAQGDGVHPAFRVSPSLLSLAASTVVIPYGGRCVDVTSTAEVLCSMLALPKDVQEQWATLQHDKATRQRKRQRVCAPIRSINDLLEWSAPTSTDDEMHRLSSRWPWATRSNRPHSDDPPPRMLVCHDFKGGYHQEDVATFTVAAPSGTHHQEAWGAYAFQAWEHTDLFVYFSHARISVPPLDWITAGHRHGVPVLGTFITEWEAGRAEWVSILTSPQRMGAVIGKLVDLAEHYGFNGYLLNVENEVAAQYVQRLTAFVKFLRKQLKERLGEDKGFVVWYDAVTTEGRLSFQNALNSNNKTFFDAADAIFLNYFWKPSSLDVSAQHCGARRADVFVGIDCFGRSTFGGGGFDCNIAMIEIQNRRQSVAMFAPGWTLENASGGTWEGFLKADAKFWGRLAPRHLSTTPSVHKASAIAGVLETQRNSSIAAITAASGVVPLLLASFSRGAGTTFYVKGEELLGTSRWVQRAGTSPSSLPSGHRQCDESALRGEYWRLPVIDDASCSPTAAVFHDAQLLTSPSPYMGDAYLALDGSSSDEGRWVQLYAFDSFPIAVPAASGSLVVEIVWRHAGADDAIAMLGVTVAASPSNGTTTALSMLTDILSKESAAQLPGGWLRTACTWELHEVAKDDQSLYLGSIQLAVPASSMTFDVGCVAIGVSTLPSASAGSVVVSHCSDVAYISGDSRSAGGLQVTFTPTTNAPLHPAHLVATLSATEAAGIQRVYLGEHLVPIELATEDSRSTRTSLQSSAAKVVVDVDVVFPAGTTASGANIASISAHCVPLQGWLSEEQVIWSR